MKIHALKALLIGSVRTYLTQEEAEYFAAEVIELDLRKPPEKTFSTGIIDDIKSWHGTSVSVQKRVDLPGFTQFDFNGLGPSLKIKDVHEELEKKARANGIAMVSITNSAGMHKMHLWTQGLAKRGLFALAAWNGGPDAVVPFNGTKGIFGTNPLSYGFPSDRGDVVIDQATSEIPFFKIVAAKKTGTPLPPNAAVDDDGELTTDPRRALDDAGVANLLPMGGGYKGYNLNYLFEVMTSALIGTKISSDMSDYIETEHGGFIIAIAIDRITDRARYDASMKSMNEEIRSQKPKAGVDKVIVPGDTNLERKAGMSDETEVTVSDEYVSLLQELANT